MGNLDSGSIRLEKVITMDMDKYECNGTLYRTRGYINNDEFDILLDAIGDKLDQLDDVKKIAPILKQVRPILATYIVDPKNVKVNELDAGLSLKIVIDIIKKLPEVLKNLGTKEDQKKSLPTKTTN